MLFSKKIDLNCVLNSYKLKQYYNKQSNEIYESFAVETNSFENIKQKISIFLLSNLSIYSVIKNIKNDNLFENEKLVETFNSVEKEKIKKWLLEIPDSKTIEIPDLEISRPLAPNLDIVQPETTSRGFGFFKDSSTVSSFNAFCVNFNKAIMAISQFFKDLKWIIKNPVKSVLMVDVFCFRLLSIFLLIFFIVSILVKMFSDTECLKKPIRILKDGTLITFVLSIVLQCFVAAGCK